MAVRQIETSIEIAVLPAKVWAILTDFAGMSAWNPVIKSISGDLKTGSRLSVRIGPPGQSGMQFKPSVIAVHSARELRWLGRLFVPGIFDGEHYFLLEPVDDDRTRFTQGEKFLGLLVGLFGGMLSATESGFHSMNAALKKRADESEIAGISHRLGTIAVGKPLTNDIRFLDSTQQ